MHQAQLGRQNGHSHCSRRVSLEHDVHNASLPDPGQIGARFGCHDDQAISPASQRAGFLQVVYVHYNHARDGQIWTLHQVNLMYAVSQKQFTEGIRMLGITYGQLDGLHASDIC